MEANTQMDDMEYEDDEMCPHEALAFERSLRLNACYYSMYQKCAECKKEKPPAKGYCDIKSCPLFFVTHVLSN